MWHIPHDLETVWDYVGMVAHYPQWWPGMKHVEILHGHELPVTVGNAFKFTVASPLYQLCYTTTVTDCDLGKMIVARSEGDLAGTGTWKFQEHAGETQAAFIWEVQLTPPVLAAASYIPRVRSVMHFFHDRLMNAGEQGLRQLLQQTAGLK